MVIPNSSIHTCIQQRRAKNQAYNPTAYCGTIEALPTASNSNTNPTNSVETGQPSSDAHKIFLYSDV